MAYLNNFENDIFISYAQLNDETPPGRDKGWVTCFREDLEYELSQRFERKGDIKIWRDKEEIGGSTFFNDAIKKAIDGSGLFIALTSRAYQSSDCYCPKELAWFYQKTKSDSYGLKVGTRSRLVNVLLQNIPPEEWLPEMEGMSGTAFHKATRKEESGHLAGRDDPFYRQQLVKLVDELETTLRTFKARSQVAVEDVARKPKGFRVFLGHAGGELNNTRERVAEELRLKGIDVSPIIPPPTESMAHAKAVEDEFKNVGLSVHLLDDEPGQKIEGEPGMTYSQKQVELGLQLGKRQLICVPKQLQADAIDSRSHSEFIKRLESGMRGDAAYKFVRETPPGLIAQEVLQEIENILKEKKVSGRDQEMAALLDIHESDEDLAPELSRVFLKRKLKLLINPASDEPDESMNIFHEVRKGVTVLIVVLGHVTDVWASRRLNFGLQVAVSSLKFCGIYAPPVDGHGTPRPIDINVFRIPPVNFPVKFVFSPQMLAGFLDEYV